MIMFTLKLVTLMLLSVVILIGVIIIAGVFLFGWLSAKTTAGLEESEIEPNPFVAGDLVRIKPEADMGGGLVYGVAYPVLASTDRYILVQTNPPLGGFHYPHTFFEKVDNRLIDLDKEYTEAIEAISSMEKLK
jgi:hypothetical protein